MISVEGVTKRYGSLVAVDRLSFEVGRGEVVGLLGPNGAGKSTTMKMLTGTLQPDAGDVLFEGAPISRDLTAAKRRVGYLPEANPLAVGIGAGEGDRWARARGDSIVYRIPSWRVPRVAPARGKVAGGG